MRTMIEITDLLDGLCPDEWGVRLDEAPVSADGVMDVLRARGVLAPPPARPKRRGLRLAVRLAVAAALALGLSVTAWAVYQALLKDYLVQTPTWLDAFTEDLYGETPARTALSLVGYQGTPEYEAYTAWEAWQAEHYGDHPMDNSGWHETPDNYYELYGAAWQDQADALDRIAAQYGVHLHESRAFAGEEDICALLGAEPFLPDEYGQAEGYIYNDGTFKLEFSSFHDDGTDDSGSLFVSVKGTITSISGYADPAAEHEEWSYQTASGPVVDLVLYPSGGGLIFYEAASAYIHASVSLPDLSRTGAASYTRADLEAWADGVDFAELSRVFGAGARFDLAGAVAELDAAYEREMQALGARLRQEKEERLAASRQVVAELGVYGPDPLPDGYYLQPQYLLSDEEPCDVSGWHKDGEQKYWDEAVYCDEAVVCYRNDAAGGSFDLWYTRYFTDAGRTAGATAEQFDRAKAYYSAYDGFLVCDIGGCPGFYYPSVTRDGMTFDAGVIWLDEAKDLMFELGRGNGYGASEYGPEPFTREELIALAGAVTAK